MFVTIGVPGPLMHCLYTPQECLVPEFFVCIHVAGVPGPELRHRLQCGVCAGLGIGSPYPPPSAQPRILMVDPPHSLVAWTLVVATPLPRICITLALGAGTFVWVDFHTLGF